MGKELSIDFDDKEYFLDAFINGLYANKGTSMIRELASNAYDASIDVDPDLPIHIITEFNQQFDCLCLEIRDFGNSMTEEFMWNTYNFLGKSTARDNVDKIGKFGLGSKSGLAYTNFHYIITRTDGKEYSWLYSKETGKFILDLLGVKDSEEKGTSVIIPIHSTYNIHKAIHETLVYFPNVVYNLYGEDNIELNNYKIVELDHLLIRVGYCPTSINKPHLVMNNVMYRIDESNYDLKFGNVALKAPNKSLELIKSREDLMQNEENIEKIVKLVQKGNIEFYKKLYKNKHECENLVNFLTIYGNNMINRFKVGDLQREIVQKENIRITYKDYKYIPFKSFIHSAYYDHSRKKTDKSFVSFCNRNYIKGKKDILADYDIENANLLTFKSMAGLNCQRFLEYKKAYTQIYGIKPLNQATKIVRIKKEIKEEKNKVLFRTINNKEVTFDEVSYYTELTWKSNILFKVFNLPVECNIVRNIKGHYKKKVRLLEKEEEMEKYYDAFRHITAMKYYIQDVLQRFIPDFPYVWGRQNVTFTVPEHLKDFEYLCKNFTTIPDFSFSLSCFTFEQKIKLYKYACKIQGKKFLSNKSINILKKWQN